MPVGYLMSDTNAIFDSIWGNLWIISTIVYLLSVLLTSAALLIVLLMIGLIGVLIPPIGKVTSKIFYKSPLIILSILILILSAYITYSEHIRPELNFKQAVKTDSYETKVCVGRIVIKDNSMKFKCVGKNESEIYSADYLNKDKLVKYIVENKNLLKVEFANNIQESDSSKYSAIIASGKFKFTYYPSRGFFESYPTIRSIEIYTNKNNEIDLPSSILKDWWIGDSNERIKIYRDKISMGNFAFKVTVFLTMPILLASIIKYIRAHNFKRAIENLATMVIIYGFIALVFWTPEESNVHFHQTICHDFYVKKADRKHRCNLESGAFRVYCKNINTELCIPDVSKLHNMCEDYCDIIKSKTVKLLVAPNNDVVDLKVVGE